MLVVVFEYLIRTVADHGLPSFPAADMSNVLTPDGYGCCGMSPAEWWAFGGSTVG